jgi:hypothetical protein
MDCVTSGFDIRKSLYPVDESGVENDIRAFSTRFARLLHKVSNTHCMCIEVYGRSCASATEAGEGDPVPFQNQKAMVAQY